MTPAPLAPLVNALLAERGYTDADFAQALEISESIAFWWLHGGVEIPSFRVPQLAYVFGLTVKELERMAKDLRERELAQRRLRDVGMVSTPRDTRYEATCMACSAEWEGFLTARQMAAVRACGARCGKCGGLMILQPADVGSMGSVKPTTLIKAAAMKRRGLVA